MGTPITCIYATIYYAYHEKKRLLTQYSNNLIDDIFGFLVPNSDPDAWTNFKQDLPFGIITWKLEDQAPSVEFLDLTITTNADRTHRDPYLPESHEPIPLHSSTVCKLT